MSDYTMEEPRRLNTIGQMATGIPIIGDMLKSWQAQQYSKTNFANQKTGFEYQKWLNQQMMQREDTAVQRRYADLKKAGINPLLAAGGQAAMAAPSRAGSAPQLESYMEKQLQHQTIRRLQSQIALDKSMEKKVAAETGLANQKALTETVETLLRTKDFDSYNERLWHSRIGLGSRVGSQVLGTIIGGKIVGKAMKFLPGIKSGKVSKNFNFDHYLNMDTGEVRKR